MREYLRFGAAAMAGLSALAVVSCNSWSPVPETDASRYELRGDVVSLRTVSYKVDSVADGYRVGDVDPMSNNIYVEFNGDGNATLLRRFDKEGRVVSEQTSVYNDKGQLMETELVSSSKGLQERTVYTYRKGRLHSMRVTDAEDSLKKYEVYRYFGDDSIRVDYSFKEDKPSGYRIMTYDERGYNTGNTMYSVKDKKLSEFKIYYNAQGRRDSVYSDNMLFGKLESSMKYDDNGFCSAMVLSGSARKTSISFKLTLDSMGNWIERISYEGNSPIPVRIEKREIKYLSE